VIAGIGEPLGAHSGSPSSELILQKNPPSETDESMDVSPSIPLLIESMVVALDRNDISELLDILRVSMVTDFGLVRAEALSSSS
jgi:hypothetical protein